MLTLKNSRNHQQAKASIRARAAALKLSLAAAFRTRRSGEVTDQPQPASLPEASPAERRGDAFPAGGVVPQDVGRGHPGNPDRADAGHGRAPHREHDMGRHETFEIAAPIAEVMLSSTMLARAATEERLAGASPVDRPEASFANQVAQAGLTGSVLAVSGIDHRDGTVSYADATGKVSRRPMAQWAGFNAMQMHSHVQGEIGRRRISEANHLPGDEQET
ncbi:hypothetical protein MKK65_19780 [Methylobacterium sp. J-001]|uniref:hypothetical protein n=1 Tax=Methylobacterium sp. J-001 TaxID=2836609 RepID=UPI001FBB705B|nr:hypothetical protein [Methylobacterium sp. J-001]MCJ2118778.1 hypothetical protein [Methylobacterium sp. J-001]